MPLTAGRGEPPLRRAMMVKDNSEPGTMMSRKESDQKAAMELAAMEGSPLNTAARSKISLTSPKVFLNTVALIPVSGRIHAMDAVARKILAVLQEDGRLTITELAARGGLSISPCHRRLRELECSISIRGYLAVVASCALSLG